MNFEFPRLIRLRQRFPTTARIDVRAAVERELTPVLRDVRRGARVAVATGSRGITDIALIVKTVVELLKRGGAEPFIVPAMGSHGGATPEGQTVMLGEFGITSERLGAPVRATMDVRRIGSTPEGVDVFFSAEALAADHIIIVNRVKPHTDFRGKIGSGILKMMVVGLGKQIGAANYHVASSRYGYEEMLRSLSRAILKTAPILCGVAIVENPAHETAQIAVLTRDNIELREEELFSESQRLMPALPFDDIDLLVVDRIGKNISGAGMDPNIIGRTVHGYSSFLGERRSSPVIRRIFARELTPETHGNAIGIGFADFTTGRLVRAMDRQVSAINALTSLTPQSVKIPIYFETDREAVGHALGSLGLKEAREAKLVWIADTLNLEHVRVSEAYLETARGNPNLEIDGELEPMVFDHDGNLRVT